MKNFEYAAPHTEAEVLQLLSPDPGHTEVLAGGTDLVGLMKKMIVTPERVVNVMDIPSMRVLEPAEDGGLVIGAATTLDEILASPYLEDYPAITDAILGINSMQLQAQGTIGGEICQRPRCWFYRNGQGLLDSGQVQEGDNQFHAILGNTGPAKFVNSSRLAPALSVLDAGLRVLGPSEDEVQLVPVGEFFRTPRHNGQREHILLPNQLVTHVVLPPRMSRFNATYEVRPGEGPEPPLAAAATSLELDSSGFVRQAQIVLGQVAPIPWIAQAAADSLVGKPVNGENAEAAGRLAVANATPLSQNEYKVQLAQVAVKRSILMAAGLETGGF